MGRGAASEVVLGFLLAAALAGAVRAARQPPASAFADPATGPPSFLPDLAHDGAERLALLPGIGAARARAIVASRPYLGAPLQPENLALLPEVGTQTAQQVQDYVAAVRREGEQR